MLYSLCILHTKFSLGSKGKNGVPPLSYSFGYLFAPDKPLDHVHVKCTQLIAGASASTNVEYVLQAESNVVHLLKYYHDYNEQTFIISVCILRFHLFAVFTCRHGSLFLQKTFRDVGAGFVVPFTTFDAHSNVH